MPSENARPDRGLSVAWSQPTAPPGEESGYPNHSLPWRRGGPARPGRTRELRNRAPTAGRKRGAGWFAPGPAVAIVLVAGGRDLAGGHRAQVVQRFVHQVSEGGRISCRTQATKATWNTVTAVWAARTATLAEKPRSRSAASIDDAANSTRWLASRSVHSSVDRLPPVVHSDLDRHGFTSALIGFAREHGLAASPVGAARPRLRNRGCRTGRRGGDEGAVDDDIGQVVVGGPVELPATGDELEGGDAV